MVQIKDVHVARQPIFDAKFNVFAYELLFRSNFINMYDTTRFDTLGAEIIDEMGIDERAVLKSYRESLIWAHELVMVN